MIFYWQVYVILISSRNWHFDMIHITWERNETSAFVSFQELQASDSGLLFTLSTESSLDMFVLNLCPFKNFGGGHARRAPDLRLWTGGRPVGPWGLWGKPQRPPAGRYKATLTNQPEGRRRSRGCMEDHWGQEAWGDAQQCSLYLHSLCPSPLRSLTVLSFLLSEPHN